MKYIKTYEAMNPRIKRGDDYPFKLHVKYEHGDADLTTKETFNFKDEKSFDDIVKFMYEVMNFIPNSAYGGLGHFSSLPGMVNSGTKESVINAKLLEIGKKYGLTEDSIYEYVIGDAHYDQGYADIDGMKATINGEEVVFVFKRALETNRISLPNIGDIIKVNPDNISGLGEKLWGGKYTDYMPNSGKKDYLIPNFDAKVIDCNINFYHDYDNKYYTRYTGFQYVLLVEASENVLKSGKTIRKCTVARNGWDPEFETKFNKEKYDGLNYYEVD